MLLHVKCLNGKRLTLHAGKEDTIEKIKENLTTNYGMHIYYLRLVYGGKRLADHTIVSTLGRPGLTLTQVLPLKKKKNGPFHYIKAECIICLEDLEGDQLNSLNCGHGGFCESCLKPMKKCPTCNQPRKPA